MPSEFRATCTVGFCWFRAMIGHRKSFQAKTNVSRPSTAIAGRAAGKTTCHTIRTLLAPSTRAASISSVGSACTRYWRMKKVPNAVTRLGRITVCSWFDQPRSDIHRYSGTTASCGGIIIVPMVSSNSRPEKRNRSLAKANPARVENSTVLTVMVPATITELNIAVPSPAWSQADWRFLNLSLNVYKRQVSSSRWEVREAAIAVHTSGARETSANTVSTTYVRGPACSCLPAPPRPRDRRVRPGLRGRVSSLVVIGTSSAVGSAAG